MIAYLTSICGGYEKRDGEKIPTQLSTENGFLENLRGHWKDNSSVLVVSADPDDIEKNDSVMDVFTAAFPMSGLPVRQMDICDKRNEGLVNNMAHYDVLILAGGHVPTQNNFFERIHLKDHLSDFDGVLIGISAGTMNSAEVVYAQPELEGESVDPEYKRFLPGLGITKLMVIPHYQSIKDDILDGQRLFEDITYPDSYGREFYALEDGSYFILEGEAAALFGAAYLIKDGAVQQICEKDKSLSIGSV